MIRWDVLLSPTSGITRAHLLFRYERRSLSGVGLRFPTTAAAIEHGKQLARRLRGDPWIEDLGLYVSVLDESGTELHREQVYRGLDRQRPERASRVSD